MNNLNAAILNTFPSVDEEALDTLLSAELARDHAGLPTGRRRASGQALLRRTRYSTF